MLAGASSAAGSCGGKTSERYHQYDIRQPAYFCHCGTVFASTVLLSCAKPGHMAGRVRPSRHCAIPEGSSVKRKTKPTAGVSLSRMALANLGQQGQNGGDDSLASLAVLLLTMTVTFTGGFDMDKYLVNRVSDFILLMLRIFRPAVCSVTIQHCLRKQSTPSPRREVSPPAAGSMEKPAWCMKASPRSTTTGNCTVLGTAKKPWIRWSPPHSARRTASV